MEIKWNYGNKVLTLPGSARAFAADADQMTLQALLYLADREWLGERDPVAYLATALRCTPEMAQAAIDFWVHRGVLETDGKPTQTILSADLNDSDRMIPGAAAGLSRKEEKAGGKIKPADALPNYTTEELADVLEARAELAGFISACQQIWGKIFNTHEVNQLLGLLDYLGLEPDYILELLAYAVQAEKKSLHFVERRAFSLYDEGVLDSGDLQERLASMRRQETFESELRTLFGLRSRALTTKEKKMIFKWQETFGYGIEMVQKAYEATVDAIGEPALPYANAVLERWFASEIKTPEEAERDLAQRAASKDGGLGSLDTDDFFEAALRRSYGKDYEQLGMNRLVKSEKSKQ